MSSRPGGRTRGGRRARWPFPVAGPTPGRSSEVEGQVTKRFSLEFALEKTKKKKQKKTRTLRRPAGEIFLEAHGFQVGWASAGPKRAPGRWCDPSDDPAMGLALLAGSEGERPLSFRGR